MLDTYTERVVSSLLAEDSRWMDQKQLIVP